MQNIYILAGEIPTSYSRLIRHHDDKITVIFKPANRLRNSIDELKIFGTVEVVLLHIDGAVTIQKNGLFQSNYSPYWVRIFSIILVVDLPSTN